MLSSHPPIELTRTQRLRVDKTFDNVYFGGKDEIFFGERIVGWVAPHSVIKLLKTWNIVDEILIWNNYPSIRLQLKQEWWSLSYGDKDKHSWEDPFKIENEGKDWGFINIDNIIRLPQKDKDYLWETHDEIVEITSRLLANEEKLRDDIISASSLFHGQAKKILLSI